MSIESTCTSQRQHAGAGVQAARLVWKSSGRSLASSKRCSDSGRRWQAASASFTERGRAPSDRLCLSEQGRRRNAHRRAGWAIVHTSHEGQSVTQVALDRKGNRNMRPSRDLSLRLGFDRIVAIAYLHKLPTREALPLTPGMAGRNPLPETRRSGVRSNRVRPIKGPANRRGLFCLRAIEFAGLDHRDAVVGASDRAVCRTRCTCRTGNKFPLPVGVPPHPLGSCSCIWGLRNGGTRPAPGTCRS